MTTIPELAETMQTLLTSSADAVARQTGFIKRQRAVTGAGFAQALVFSFLAQPAATREEVQQAAAAAGMRITTPGLDQRFNAQAVLFLDTLLQRALAEMVEVVPAVGSLLNRFQGVFVADCTTIALPAALASVWAGPNGGADAAVKLAVRWDLHAGGLQLWLGDGRQHDQQTGVCASGLPVGSLRLNDLGFFNLDTFQADLRQGVAFFSRYKIGTNLYTADGQPLDLVALLKRRRQQALDLPIQLGRQRLPCRLLAVPVPAKRAAERRRRLRYRAKRKCRPVSPTSLALAGWTLYVTSLSGAQLTVAEALILGMTRWQIERLFKLWKGSGLLDEYRSQDPWRVWCEFYAKLLALLIQHWLLLVGCWQRLDRSLHQAARLIAKQAFHLLAHLRSRTGLITALTQVADTLAHAGHLRKRRRHPLMFQYWLETVHD